MDLFYSFYAVRNENGLCPTGWHVPTESELSILRSYVPGGTSTGGGLELKSCKQVNSIWGGDCNTANHPRWDEHEVFYGADLYGFSALPSGNRSEDGTSFNHIGTRSYWWTSTQTHDTSLKREKTNKNNKPQAHGRDVSGDKRILLGEPNNPLGVGEGCFGKIE